jgi:hypothetical protein
VFEHTESIPSDKMWCWLLIAVIYVPCGREAQDRVEVKGWWMVWVISLCFLYGRSFVFPLMEKVRIRVVCFFVFPLMGKVRIR